jgi:hypothetical protein
MRHAAPDVIAKLAAGEAVDPALVYFRTTPTFETSAPELQWLTRAGESRRSPREGRRRTTSPFLQPLAT